jgi:hypothetical protein
MKETNRILILGIDDRDASVEVAVPTSEVFLHDFAIAHR